MKFRRKAADPTRPSSTSTTRPSSTDEAAGPGAGHRRGHRRALRRATTWTTTDERVDLGRPAGPAGRGHASSSSRSTTRPATCSRCCSPGPEGALELRVFAAPRNGDLWSEVRPQIAADLGRRGGTATEREGRFGTELVCQIPVKLPDGKTATQPSRIIGINGSRWMLRATLLGRPARRARRGRARSRTRCGTVVVRRGSHAMPVGDPLPSDPARRTPDGRAPSLAEPSPEAEEQDAPQPEPVGQQLRPARARAAADGAASQGSSPSTEAPDRTMVKLSGTLRTVTLRPRGGVPALEAELFDGSGAITLVWLGRRQITGISPGRQLEVEGRIGVQDGVRVMYNPRYELRACMGEHAARAGRRDRRGRRTPPARHRARRPAGDGRGRGADADVHGAVADRPATCSLALIVSVGDGAAAARGPAGAALDAPVRASTRCSASASVGCSCTSQPAAAAAPTTRRWPTSCPASSTTRRTSWCSPSPA